MSETLITNLTKTLDDALERALQILPTILGMVIIVAIGWVIARLAMVVVRRLLQWVKFDAVCGHFGITQTLAKADLPQPTALLAKLVFWVVLGAFFLLGVSTLGVVALQEQLTRLFLSVLQIAVALVILVIGLLVANFVSRTVLLGLVNANVPSPRLLSGAVRVFLIVLAVAMALEQLALAKSVFVIAFSIAFGSVMLGLAIAFGLGGQGVAKRFLERQFLEKTKTEKDEISHL